MNRLELRGEVGERTYEAGRKLLESGAVSLEAEIDGSLRVYSVKDKPLMHVAVWDRKGAVSIECGCTPKAMGGRHCAAVYLAMYDDDAGYADEIRQAIRELGEISFHPLDYCG